MTGDSERGSTLVIALFFATIFSTLVAAVLTFNDVGRRAAVSYEAQGRTSYSAAGATDAAIKRFSAGSPCGDYTSPAINGQTMVIHCDDLKASGGGPLLTRPDSALLTLGATPESLQATTDLRVQGSVFSNSTINPQPGGSMVVAGDVSAVGACTQVSQPPLAPSQSPYALRCGPGAGGGDPVVGADPDYTAALTTAPPRQAVPACPAAPAWLVTLAPGYYDDPSALSALTGGGCPNAVVWMQPGNYYLDFTFRFPGGTGLWTVSDKTVAVVGGTPFGWDPTAPSRPAIPNPGGCDATRLVGVEVQLGGGSRLEVDGGKVELCAPANLSSQQIALYGTPAPRTVHTLKPTTIAAVSGFADASHALLLGEEPVAPGCSPVPPSGAADCTADASLGSATVTSASLQLSGFAPVVPDGSVIRSATLRIRHEDDGDPTQVTVTAPFAGNTCGTDSGHTNAQHPLPQHATMVEDHVDLKACGLSDPSVLADFTVTYAASLGGGTSATDHLDGIWLDVAYTAPTTFRSTSVVTSTGFAHPTDALEIGEQPTARTADAALASAGATTASITLAGYGEPPLPTGSTIDSAVLRVSHLEAGQAAAPTVTVSAGSCTNLALPLQAGVLGDSRVDLRACGLTTDTQLAGLTATFSASLASGGSSGTDSLDGMWLEVASTPPPSTRDPITATSTDFANPDDALVIDGTTADATVAAAPVSLALTGYDHPTLPPGSRFDSALLRVAHQDLDTSTPAAAPPSPAVTLTGPSYTGPCTTAQALTVHPAALATDTIDLVGTCRITDPFQLAGLTVTYTATPGAGSTSGTDKLDGIALDLVARPPATRVPGTAASTAGSGTAAFATPDAGRVVDGSTASATLDTATPTASIHLGGFAALDMPTGSVIDKAVLRVAHQDDDTTPPPPPPPPTPPPPTPSPPTATLSWSFTGDTCTGAVPLPSHPGAVAADAPIDVAACGLTDPAQVTGLTATYAAALGADSTNATDQLDGLELDVVYRVPLLEPLAADLTGGPYPTSGHALVKTTDGAGSGQTRLVVDGTIYAPTAALDLTMSQVSAQVVTRGLIGRTIRLGIAAAPGYTRSVLGVPPEPVLFTTYPTVVQAPATVAANSGFTNPDNARQIDGATADASVGAGATASITLAGYGAPPPADPGSVDGAVLRVDHEDDGATVSLTVAVAFPGSTCDGSAGNPALQVPLRSGTPVEDQLDLKGLCGLADDGPATLSGLTVKVTATAGATGATEHLNGTQLDFLAHPFLKAAVAFDGGRATIEEWSVQR